MGLKLCVFPLIGLLLLVVELNGHIPTGRSIKSVVPECARDDPQIDTLLKTPTIREKVKNSGLPIQIERNQVGEETIYTAVWGDNASLNIHFDPQNNIFIGKKKGWTQCSCTSAPIDFDKIQQQNYFSKNRNHHHQHHANKKTNSLSIDWSTTNRSISGQRSYAPVPETDSTVNSILKQFYKKFQKASLYPIFSTQRYQNFYRIILTIPNSIVQKYEILIEVIDGRGKIYKLGYKDIPTDPTLTQLDLSEQSSPLIAQVLSIINQQYGGILLNSTLSAIYRAKPFYRFLFQTKEKIELSFLIIYDVVTGAVGLIQNQYEKINKCKVKENQQGIQAGVQPNQELIQIQGQSFSTPNSNSNVIVTTQTVSQKPQSTITSSNINTVNLVSPKPTVNYQNPTQYEITVQQQNLQNQKNPQLSFQIQTSPKNNNCRNNGKIKLISEKEVNNPSSINSNSGPFLTVIKQNRKNPNHRVSYSRIFDSYLRNQQGDVSQINVDSINDQISSSSNCRGDQTQTISQTNNQNQFVPQTQTTTAQTQIQTPSSSQINFQTQNVPPTQTFTAQYQRIPQTQTTDQSQTNFQNQFVPPTQTTTAQTQMIPQIQTPSSSQINFQTQNVPQTQTTTAQTQMIPQIQTTDQSQTNFQNQFVPPTQTTTAQYQRIPQTQTTDQSQTNFQNQFVPPTQTTTAQTQIQTPSLSQINFQTQNAPQTQTTTAQTQMIPQIQTTEQSQTNFQNQFVPPTQTITAQTQIQTPSSSQINFQAQNVPPTQTFTAQYQRIPQTQTTDQSQTNFQNQFVPPTQTTTAQYQRIPQTQTTDQSQTNFQNQFVPPTQTTTAQTQIQTPSLSQINFQTQNVPQTQTTTAQTQMIPQIQTTDQSQTNFQNQFVPPTQTTTAQTQIQTPSLSQINFQTQNVPQTQTTTAQTQMIPQIQMNINSQPASQNQYVINTQKIPHCTQQTGQVNQIQFTSQQISQQSKLPFQQSSGSQATLISFPQSPSSTQSVQSVILPGTVDSTFSSPSLQTGTLLISQMQPSSSSQSQVNKSTVTTVQTQIIPSPTYTTSYTKTNSGCGNGAGNYPSAQPEQPVIPPEYELTDYTFTNQALIIDFMAYLTTISYPSSSLVSIYWLKSDHSSILLIYRTTVIVYLYYTTDQMKVILEKKTKFWFDDAPSDLDHCLVKRAGKCQRCFYRYYLTSDKLCKQVQRECSSYDRVSGVCLTCYTGFYLDQYKICQKQYFLCKTSGVTGNCTSCYGGYTILNGTCVSSLSWSSSAATTQQRLSNPLCLTWPYSTQCSVCVTGAYLDKNGICQIPDPNCQQFNTRNETCLACYQGYRLVNGKCIRGKSCSN